MNRIQKLQLKAWQLKVDIAFQQGIRNAMRGVALTLINANLDNVGGPSRQLHLQEADSVLVLHQPRAESLPIVVLNPLLFDSLEEEQGDPLPKLNVD